MAVRYKHASDRSADRIIAVFVNVYLIFVVVVVVFLLLLHLQQHEVILQNKQRAGFLIGDGAGVGKGRTVAGIILENYLRGRKKALW